ncbi:phosphoribulokinase/uridine kinase [Lipomyces japonicus]|uniref:phosphoribulokinase/uridine kinase n=1 Tax=Lipomyces japonicus TaxID=56871 RepID=UPI0034CEB7B9
MTSPAIANLVARLHDLDQRVAKDRHVLVGLAGVPGSGKSTISAKVVEKMKEVGETIQIAPMDGYHLTRAQLQSLDDPKEAFRRRGAPFTFDSESFVKLIRTIHDQKYTGRVTDATNIISAPTFDHCIGDPLPDTLFISSSSRFIIIEGNYILLNFKPWSEIKSLCDETWLVTLLPEEAEVRVAKRHVAAGIEPTYEEALDRARGNDLVNGALVYQYSMKADLIIDNSSSGGTL